MERLLQNGAGLTRSMLGKGRALAVYHPQGAWTKRMP